MKNELELQLEHEMESARWIEVLARSFSERAELCAAKEAADPVFWLRKKENERFAQALREAAELMRRDILYRNDELLDEPGAEPATPPEQIKTDAPTRQGKQHRNTDSVILDSEKIKKLMQDCGYKKNSELAEDAGVSESSVSKARTGKRIRFGTAYSITRALGAYLKEAEALDEQEAE